MPNTTLAEAEVAFLVHHRSLNHSPNTIEHYAWTFIDLHRFLNETGRGTPLEPRLILPLAPKEPFKPFAVLHGFLAETGQDAPCGGITTATLQAFHTWLVATPIKKAFRGQHVRSARGIAGRMKDIRAFLRWLEAEEWIERAPKVPIPKVPQTLFPILSDADLVTLFSCQHLTAKGEQGVRNRAIVALLLDSAIRRAELVGLQPADLLLDDGLIRVTGKGSKTRLVPLSTAVADYIRAWLTIRGLEAGPLFWLTQDGVKMLMRRIQCETGLHLYCHKLRHTSASKLVRSGVDLHSVKRILGHQQLSTVEIYLSLDASDLRTKHNAASPFDSIQALMPEQEQKSGRRRLKLN